VKQQRSGEAPDFGALATEQAALRRVATLVARGVSPSELLPIVAAEMARCLEVHHAVVGTYEGEDALTIVGVYDEDGPAKLRVGQRLTLDGDSIATRVLSNRRPARMEIRDHAPGSVAGWVRELAPSWRVGAPIVVNGRTWGLAVVGSPWSQPLPPDTEARIGEFTDLVATAIAAATTRAALEACLDRVAVLAEQQAALRRVATLVARELAPAEVFAGVAEEMARCMRVENAAVLRFEADGAVPIVGGRDEPQTAEVAVAERYSSEVDHVAALVLATGRPARIDNHNRHAIGAPIVVDGRVWGLAVVASSASQPLPPTTEDRIGDFAELVATAIRNAAARAELKASRKRIVAAADDARRRLERDLHDGAQQRLVSLAIETQMAQALVPPELDDLKSRLSRIVSGLTDISAELRELSHGIHPAILARGGLGPALDAVARRSAVPVTLDLALNRRLPECVEVAAYYVVAEALTNAAKHAQASEVTVRAVDDGDALDISVCDDGVGGADFDNGSGLVGLTDRVEALDGRLHLVSPPEVGTSLSVSIPVDGR
jgi:signal transduction histidine kinase